MYNLKIFPGQAQPKGTGPAYYETKVPFYTERDPYPKKILDVPLDSKHFSPYPFDGTNYMFRRTEQDINEHLKQLLPPPFFIIFILVKMCNVQSESNEIYFS